MSQLIFLQNRTKPRDTREYIVEVLKYRGQLDLAKEFEAWETPKFPVSGHHLKEAGCPPGKAMSIVFGKVKDRWKESNFVLDLEELIKQVPDVIDSVDISQFEKGKKKRKS